MISAEIENYLGDLYRNIFSEDANNSKQFIIFARNGNPHPLRIKVEDALVAMKEELVYAADFANNEMATSRIVEKISLLVELDTFVTNYIDSYGKE